MGVVYGPEGLAEWARYGSSLNMAQGGAEALQCVEDLGAVPFRGFRSRSRTLRRSRRLGSSTASMVDPRRRARSGAAGPGELSPSAVGRGTAARSSLARLRAGGADVASPGLEVLGWGIGRVER